MNIMIVEDDPVNLKLLSAILGSGGHHISERISAEHVLETVRAGQPEVILLDLKLPGIDGLSLARHLKQDPATRHIPIVAITAAAETFPREAALAAGCDAYIVKPVDIRKLAGQVTGAGPPGPRGAD